MNLLAQYIYNLFLALDQLINTVILFGHPDESVSSRLGRAIGKERYFWVAPLRVLVDAIFFFDKSVLDNGYVMKHCEKSIIPYEQLSINEFKYELWSWEK
tara:strand:+ start:5337 stop:5636 length:300 start_codon:yes stop_codon:yes gene_type:complete